jgi:hypothetical protein
VVLNGVLLLFSFFEARGDRTTDDLVSVGEARREPKRPTDRKTTPMKNQQIHHVSSAMRTLYTATLAIFVGASITACDTEDGSDDEPREVQCNLSDPECMALPEAAEAITVVESMDIDPDEADIELRVVVDAEVAELFSSEDETVLESIDDANDANADAPPVGPHAHGDSLVRPLDPVALAGAHATSCPNGPSGVCCTCVWGDGYEWGCACG